MHVLSRLSRKFRWASGIAAGAFKPPSKGMKPARAAPLHLAEGGLAATKPGPDRGRPRAPSTQSARRRALDFMASLEQENVAGWCVGGFWWRLHEREGRMVHLSRATPQARSHNRATSFHSPTASLPPHHLSSAPTATTFCGLHAPRTQASLSLEFSLSRAQSRSGGLFPASQAQFWRQCSQSGESHARGGC